MEKKKGFLNLFKGKENKRKEETKIMTHERSSKNPLESFTVSEFESTVEKDKSTTPRDYTPTFNSRVPEEAYLDSYRYEDVLRAPIISKMPTPKSMTLLHFYLEREMSIEFLAKAFSKALNEVKIKMLSGNLAVVVHSFSDQVVSSKTCIPKSQREFFEFLSSIQKEILEAKNETGQIALSDIVSDFENQKFNLEVEGYYSKDQIDEIFENKKQERRRFADAELVRIRREREEKRKQDTVNKKEEVKSEVQTGDVSSNEEIELQTDVITKKITTSTPAIEKTLGASEDIFQETILPVQNKTLYSHVIDLTSLTMYEVEKLEIVIIGTGKNTSNALRGFVAQRVLKNYHTCYYIQDYNRPDCLENIAGLGFTKICNIDETF